MTNVLTSIGAALGLALFLIMAVVPLFLDGPERGVQGQDGPEQDREPIAIPVVQLRLPAQREPVRATRVVHAGRRPVGPRV
jgi:hypothetical protein